MFIRVIAGPGLGQVIDAIPAVARAWIAGGTAVLVETEKRIETAMLEPRSSTAVTAAQNPSPRLGPVQPRPKQKQKS
jgi:hypothetical protein